LTIVDEYHGLDTTIDWSGWPSTVQTNTPSAGVDITSFAIALFMEFMESRPDLGLPFCPFVFIDLLFLTFKSFRCGTFFCRGGFSFYHGSWLGFIAWIGDVVHGMEWIDKNVGGLLSTRPLAGCAFPDSTERKWKVDAVGESMGEDGYLDIDTLASAG